MGRIKWHIDVLGEKMIRQIISTFAVIASPVVLNANEVILRCDAPGQPTEQIEFLNIDMTLDRIVHTSHSRHVTIFQIAFSTSGEVIAFGERHGRTSRIQLDRITGFGRIDDLRTDDDKPSIWNEKTNSIGYPIDEEVWLGYDLNCIKTDAIF